MIRFFDPGRSYLAIKDEIDAEMQRVLAAGDLILRSDVEKFEENLAKYVGTKYAVGVASGTDALILSLKASGLKEGDFVSVPSYTFRATVEAVKHAGGRPLLYDIGQQAGAKYIIPAHIAGEVLYPHQLWPDAIVIEDACQAIGAAPVRGLAACYSFYPAKILGCYGDGGAIATNDKNLYEELLKLRNHDKGRWEKVGYNSRLDNIQAAVLNVKLKYLPGWIKRRKEIAVMYDNYLNRVGTPPVREVYQDYIITHPNRDGLKDYLAAHGIESMTNGYPFPAQFPKGPMTLDYEARSLRIPCNPDMTDSEVLQVIARINMYGV